MLGNSSTQALRYRQGSRSAEGGLQEIRSYLWSVNIKDNSDLYARLSEIERTGSQQKMQLIMGTIRESLAANTGSPSLRHFACLLDYLLTLPAFSAVLHHFLVQFYCDLFKHLLCQQNYEALDELKIVRKYWVKKINYSLYSQMQQIVLNFFQVDLERIPQEALSDLKKFYIQSLGMTYNDVYLYLPQLKDHPNLPSQQRTTYVLSRKAHQGGQCNPPSSKSHDANIQKTKIQPIKQQDSEKNPEGWPKNLPLSPSQAESLKRVRQESEETTVSTKCAKKFRLDYEESLNENSEKTFENLNSQISQIQINSSGSAQNRSRSKKSRVEKSSKSVASEFNFLLCHVCQQCNHKFELKEQLENHLNEHSSNHLANKEQQNVARRDCVIVTEVQTHNFTRACRVCDKFMEVEYKNGGWMFHNCVMLNVYDVDIIVHVRCSSQVIIPADEPSTEASVEPSQ